MTAPVGSQPAAVGSQPAERYVYLGIGLFVVGCTAASMILDAITSQKTNTYSNETIENLNIAASVLDGSAVILGASLTAVAAKFFADRPHAVPSPHKGDTPLKEVQTDVAA